ncbi:MAG: GxxExxY protein [Paludibacteraceae bacterium]|nr:GxxExxY protein [Paludibacteraceae bacterium]MBR1472708.1 GxxExxY protein [Paludibacteraceae bacterium]
MEKVVVHKIDGIKREKLVQSCYGIIGCMQEVHKNLGAGLPEYIYQEALFTELSEKGYIVYKELECHPTYKGKAMKAYIKMDLVIDSEDSKIIVECKAISQLTEREHYQLFGYLRATGWSIGLLVNFGTSPKAQIERYYNDDGEIMAF